MSARAIVCFLIAAAPCASLRSQTTKEPEVRRALPVDRPITENYQNPDWVKRVNPPASATPAPSPNAPQPDPQVPFRPERKSSGSPSSGTEAGIQPAPLPPVRPTTPSPTPAPQPKPADDEAGSIRIGPTAVGAAEQQQGVLDRANSFYARKMYDLAVPEYEMFLVSSGDAKLRDGALFRLAECHRILGNSAAARAGYEKLVMEFRKGEFAGAGAYRLGEMLFEEKLYEASAAQFATAATEAKDREIRLAAKYFSARSLDYLKRSPEAREAYRAVVSTDGKNPYRDHALLALANLDVSAGKKAEGLTTFEAVAGLSKDPEIVAEACVKAAALAAELKQNAKALTLFDKAAKVSETSEWRPAALVGAMRLRYQTGDYAGIAEMGTGVLEKVPAETKPEVLQILASSQRQSGKNLQARQTYDLLLKEFPDSAPAREAPFQRLACLYALKDKNLVAEIDAFLEKTTDPKDRTQALRLKAETLFKQGDYAGAGKTYTSLLEKNLPPDQDADALYKAAWCLAAVEKPQEAISAYSAFIDKYPTHPLAATALAQRAQAKQQSKAFDAAIEDYDLLISKYPGSKEREIALLQKALIFGQQQKYEPMSAAFEKLLEEFPKSAAAAQAYFWLGWAAFEQKNYKKSTQLLEKSRAIDPAQYGERATLRMILAFYYLDDRAAVTREAAIYKGKNLPAEISLWLAVQLIAEGKNDKAEALLLPLTKNPAAVPAEAWISLAEVQVRLGKFKQARMPTDKALEAARDPASRARALIASARIYLGEKDFRSATSQIEEALLLQPEGRLNAEARLASGDVLFAQADFDGAARAYMTISVLSNDPAVAPRALQQAATAYRRANNKDEADKAAAELKQRFPDSQPSTKL